MNPVHQCSDDSVMHSCCMCCVLPENGRNKRKSPGGLEESLRKRNKRNEQCYNTKQSPARALRPIDANAQPIGLSPTTISPSIKLSPFIVLSPLIMLSPLIFLSPLIMLSPLIALSPSISLSTSITLLKFCATDVRLIIDSLTMTMEGSVASRLRRTDIRDGVR